GSPNPPVCTCWTGIFVFGFAVLPPENTSVFTAGFGGGGTAGVVTAISGSTGLGCTFTSFGISGFGIASGRGVGRGISLTVAMRGGGASRFSGVGTGCGGNFQCVTRKTGSCGGGGANITIS